MFDVGDLVKFKRDSSKVGLIIDKKLITDKRYAAPLGIRRGERDRERLALLCYWASGETNWCDPLILIDALEDKKCLNL
jgi:hypothetical protein